MIYGPAMSKLNGNWSWIVGLVVIAFIVVGVGIFIMLYFILFIRNNYVVKRRDRKSTRQISGGLYPNGNSVYSDSDEYLLPAKVKKTTDINCSLEYRTRGSQLIISLSKVIPSDLCNSYIKNISGARLYFVVFLNGDYNNTPCESTKKAMDKKLDMNEIFIFTVMPYDLPALELVMQAILLTDDCKYIIGELHKSLYDLDQQANIVQRTCFLPFPDQRLILSDCLLCLCITVSKNLIKMKIIRLHMLDCSFPDDNITGLSMRLSLTTPSKTIQMCESTKKKYKSSLMFNETMIFETLDLEKKDLQMTIEMLESRKEDNEEIINVCGTISMCYDLFHEDNFNKKWMEAVDNMDTEVIRWYPISYNKLG